MVKQKRIRIIIEVNDKKYKSDETEASDKEIQDLEEAIVKAVSGKLEYFSIIHNGHNVYFSKVKLYNSVITLEIN